MCKIVHYKDFHCGHRWAVITLSCYPGFGFDNCPSLFDGRAKPYPQKVVAQGHLCPTCDLKGQYDRNYTRMVEKNKHGFRWGLGPNEQDWGRDITCVIL
ncbi:hypothetical protein QBC41DRAFT_235899 [Cercophora samala]|uniref:Uncharacterized protein n=1 Tax=Cercophora samala TaxID=330535 RepID=A0AA39YZS2_9PEZI|nr:hypothetical protein QBC41DRAFT_235899 [Cercophora samala]